MELFSELFRQLDEIGPLGWLRLRAEHFLREADRGELSVLYQEREELDRIASAPRMDDKAFLLSLEVTDQLIAEAEQNLQELKNAREAWKARRHTPK
jgi:hypothetical protein